eukprot:jgi/Ulvmu1/9487/UM052_0057.1
MPYAVRLPVVSDPSILLHPEARMDLAAPALCASKLARRHLDDCRQHVQRGDAPSAMHCLLQAVSHMGGEAGAADAQKLRDDFLARVRTMDDLQTLLSGLQLTTQETRRGPADGMSAAPSTASSMSSSLHGVHIAQDSRGQAALSCQQESSSFHCPSCGGVFALDRREQHYSQWCPALQHRPGHILCLDSDSGSDMVT